MSAMTGRHRLEAAMRGLPVDRPPIWLREGFPIVEGPAGADDFQLGWQSEPVYQDLFRRVAPFADPIQGWHAVPFDRTLMVPPSCMRTQLVLEERDRKRRRTIIRTPRGDLCQIDEVRRGVATTWRVKYPVESAQDLEKLASVPFEVSPQDIGRSLENYERARSAVGERGLLRLGISSPIVCISDTMPFQLFLEMSVTHRRLFHELAQEVTRRTLAVLEALFAAGNLDTTANLGGAEQCTPPMMRPQAFEEYVVPYDGQIVRWLKERGMLVNMHCHGKVRHALPLMIQMGIDSTDPVEPPPAGDLTYAQAREIAAGRLTLVGNLEFSELEHARPEHIRARVRELLSLGTERLILAASAGPVSAITPRLAANYVAWVEAALEHSRR